MIAPQHNSKVKIVLKNNIIIIGFVDFWSLKHNNCKINMIDSNSYTIIPNLNEILFYTVIVEDSSNKIDTSSQPNVNKKRFSSNDNIEKLKVNIEEVVSSKEDTDLKVKSIAELKEKLSVEERKNIEENLKKVQFKSSETQYGYPGFFKKPKP